MGRIIVALSILGLLAASCLGNAHALPMTAAAPGMTGLHVVGNQIENGAGQPVRLLGANRGATNACVQNWGIFSGPTDQSTVDAMRSWGITAVRIPLNEDCWLGINQGSNSSSYYGTNYQAVIETYVSELNTDGIAAILDLHWSAPGTAQAANQQIMPDADHAPAFWTSVATAFAGNTSVVFDLYNEPYPDNNGDTTAAWQCWLNGCTESSYSSASGYQDVTATWQAVGMQSLVNTVRATGAQNVILTGGIGWGGILDQFNAYKPTDPTGNLAAGMHVYPGTWCHDLTCWQSQIGNVAQTTPVIVGEFGETDCAGTFVDPLMSYLDSVGASYLAWFWWQQSDVGCGNYPLITSYSTGAPSPYGHDIMAHLQGLAGIATPTPIPPTATVNPTSAYQYDWEGNLQGWHTVGGASTLSIGTTAYHGTGSLAFTEPNGAADWTPAFTSQTVAGLAAGVTLTAHVYAPAGTQNISWSFMVGTASNQYFGNNLPVTPGQWSTVSWPVPATVTAPITYMGGQANNPSGCAACTVYVDALSWPVSTPTPTATSTPTATATSTPTDTPTPTNTPTSTPTATPFPTVCSSPFTINQRVFDTCQIG